ncbi:MAG TPA: FG-GAP-like repeat-containing protein [Pyrinomonadaceae bacterium]|nr:FG-GAP-like repeat-containing protein [Pyrinomonadaceae bacterium]
MNRFITAVLLLCTVAIAEQVVAQDVKFTSPVTYPAGSPYVVASGDFNGDGKQDLVAGDVQHNDLVMLLGNGDGTLKPPATYHQSAAPHYLVANDFNRDGKLDLATANPYAANISVFFGKGDGSFETPVNYPVGRFPNQLRAADFNRDGWLDLAVFGGNNDVNVLLGSGNGAFQNPVSYGLNALPGALAAGDVNGDGVTDLIAGMRSVQTVNVLLGNGDGTFKTPISSSSNATQNGTGPYASVVGDFDRDGKLDVALSDEVLKIMKGNGDGTFKAPSFNYRLRNTSADLKPADFNGDGKLELVSAGVFNSGALQILLGNGDATFQDAGDQVSGSSSISIAVTDLNGDTRSDLVANINNQLAVALVNVTPGNPDKTDYFVHQHYVDFLDREPDVSGFGFWSNQIDGCGANQACVEIKRINVSAAFYLSIEFQQTAYLVERAYKTAYGDALGSSTTGGPHELAVPIVRFNELQMDTQQIDQDVVVNQTGWAAVLENNKQNFMVQFVQRSRFVSQFPTSMTPSQFVDKLNQNAGAVLSSSERATAIDLFGGAPDTSNIPARAQALRQVAENHNLYVAEFNRAFVLMEYFGYLRRNPNEGQDTDFSGYDYWLNKLNTFNGNFVNAEMVKAFISSGEYRGRFTP